MNMTKEEKLYFDRLSDCSLRLETIHKLRWIILENLGNSNNVDDKQYYVEANENFNEVERETWIYIKGHKKMKKTNEYKTINLKMFPIDSEASQYEINKKINEMAKEGWELLQQQVYDEWHILLTFKRTSK